MTYFEIPPPAYLKNYVKTFWVLEGVPDESVDKKLGPLVDGCPGIIFQPKHDGIYYDQIHQPMFELFLYGQTLTRTTLFMDGKFNTVGVLFFPNVLKSVFGLDAFELKDDCLDLNSLTSSRTFSLNDKLLNTSNKLEQIEVLAGYLKRIIDTNKYQADEVTSEIIHELDRSNYQISFQQLYSNLKISGRSVERRFRAHIGISPHLFARIMRFHNALIQIEKGNYGKLSDVAYDNGYTDQPHFIREFKSFSGFSPYQFRKASGNLLKDLISSNSKMITPCCYLLGQPNLKS